MLAAQKIPVTEKKIRKVRPVIDPERCKGCGICTAFCPEKILVLGNHLNEHGYPVVKMTRGGTCRGCRSCALMCPDLVFSFVREENGACKS